MILSYLYGGFYSKPNPTEFIDSVYVNAPILKQDCDEYVESTINRPILLKSNKGVIL